MAELDELENIARRAEAFEKKVEADSAVESPTADPAKPEPVFVSPGRMDAAANRAEGILRVTEQALQFLVDPRLMMGEGEFQMGRSSLAPVIEKYNLMGEGDGNLPYQAEMSAGFYLGGLYKRIRRAIAALRAVDEAKAKAEKQASEQSNNGNKREYQSQESPRNVSSQVGVREEPSPQTEGWNRESWGKSSPLG